MNIDSIGKIIRCKRRALGLSQSELAQLAGVSRVSIGQLERGDRGEFGLSKVGAILNHLDLEIQVVRRHADSNMELLGDRLEEKRRQRLADAIALRQGVPAGEIQRHNDPFGIAPPPVVIADLEGDPLEEAGGLCGG